MSENTKTTVSPQSSRGFYASALQGELLAEYQRALGMEGLEEEIALLRSLIKVVLIRSTSAGLSMFLKAFACLDHLCKTHRKLFKDKNIDTKQVSENLHQMLFEFIEPDEGNAGPATTPSPGS
jgi:hypothetical protein